MVKIDQVFCVSRILLGLAVGCRQVQTARNGASSYKIDYVAQFQGILNLKDIQIASFVQKLSQFCWLDDFCLLVELYQEGSAQQACL